MVTILPIAISTVGDCWPDQIERASSVSAARVRSFGDEFWGKYEPSEFTLASGLSGLAALWLAALRRKQRAEATTRTSIR